LSRSQLLAAANTSFGSSGSSAVSLKCTKTNGVSYLTEVWVNLNKNNLSQFPASTSLVTNANVAGTCPSTNIFIAKP
jgi:ribonuclease T2